MKYKTKGLEMLMYDGVHPEKIGEQHKSWARTWVSIKDVVGHSNYDYRGLGYIYFINHQEAKLYCFNSDAFYLEGASDDENKQKIEAGFKKFEEQFNPETCVWVEVSCHQCYRTDAPQASW